MTKPRIKRSAEPASAAPSALSIYVLLNTAPPNKGTIVLELGGRLIVEWDHLDFATLHDPTDFVTVLGKTATARLFKSAADRQDYEADQLDKQAST